MNSRRNLESLTMLGLPPAGTRSHDPRLLLGFLMDVSKYTWVQVSQPAEQGHTCV